MSSQSTRRPGQKPAQKPMAAGRAIAVVLLGSLAAGVLAAVLLLVAAERLAPGSFSGPVAEGAWTARSRACFVPSGFFDAEFDAEGERHFSWTRGVAHLAIPRLNRSRPHRVTLAIASGRPAGVPAPTVRAAVDGVVTATIVAEGERQALAIDIPARAGTGVVVTLDVSPTFVPGPQDTRELGVVVDSVTVEAGGAHFRPATGVILAAGLAVMLAAAGFLACGLRVRAAAAASVPVAIAFVWLLLADGAFLGVYVDRLVGIGAGTAGAGILIGALARRRSTAFPEWPVAVVILLCATVIKLAVFGHPLAQVGDAMFQVHRAQDVHAGRYFFTSVTPKPFFEFPYPVALYVAAQPLWRFFQGDMNLVFLLRGITLVADAVVGFALYAAARRQWASGRVALFCAMLWPLARAPIESVSYANLTNAFGQAVFGSAMGGVAWLAAGPASIAALLLTCAGLVVAFLSHFSTISIGLPILGAAAAALVFFGKEQTRKAAIWVIALTLAAGAVSYAVYYSHFNGVYRQTLSRLTDRQQAPVSASKLVAPPTVKLQRWWTSTGDDYGRPGVPLMATAAVGAGLLLWRRRREGVTIVLLAWVAVWVGLTLLGIFSPVSMRMNLAAAPALVGLAAYALGSLACWSWPGAALAALAVVPLGADAIRVCFVCLGRIPPGWFSF